MSNLSILYSELRENLTKKINFLIENLDQSSPNYKDGKYIDVLYYDMEFYRNNVGYELIYYLNADSYTNHQGNSSSFPVEILDEICQAIDDIYLRNKIIYKE